jgi:hypothetical protein
MEVTGNKRVALIVIEGGDNPEMIDRATNALLVRRNMLHKN